MNFIEWWYKFNFQDQQDDIKIILNKCDASFSEKTKSYKLHNS